MIERHLLLPSCTELTLRVDTNHFYQYSFSYSNENSDLAADLVKILSECQQEVPDYLANGGGGGGGMAAQGKIDFVQV